LTERRELTPAVTIALVNKHHALSGEFFINFYNINALLFIIVIIRF
jgi:hypothetical protein